MLLREAVRPGKLCCYVMRLHHSRPRREEQRAEDSSQAVQERSQCAAE